MCIILKTGGRKITPKMESAIKNGIEKCKNNPLYNEVVRIEQELNYNLYWRKLLWLKSWLNPRMIRHLGLYRM